MESRYALEDAIYADDVKRIAELWNESLVNIQLNTMLETPLIIATKLGRLEIVKFLIQNGADINMRDYTYSTATHWAVHNEFMDVLKFLLSHNPNLTIKDRFDRDVLDWIDSMPNLKKFRFVVLRHIESRIIQWKKDDKDCLICYERKTRFWKCSQCVYEHCRECHLELLQRKCPFCRVEFNLL